MSLVEVLVAVAIMAIVAGSLSTLVGAAVRTKMTTSVRSADTETARQTLEWMSERMRNAGLNIRPGLQAQARCKDMVVALDAGLRPQTSSVYLSGEIYNTNTVAGDEVITIGYRLDSGVVAQDTNSCASATWAPVTEQVSNPAITVTGLTFAYFHRNGSEIVVPTSNVNEIRDIRMIRVTLTVQAASGRSGVQTQTFSRMIMLRNPRPDTNDWLPPQETNP
jgi:type II secretory pathway component PulJ